MGLDMLEHQIVFFGIHLLVIQDKWREEKESVLMILLALALCWKVHHTGLIRRALHTGELTLFLLIPIHRFNSRTT